MVQRYAAGVLVDRLYYARKEIVLCCIVEGGVSAATVGSNVTLARVGMEGVHSPHFYVRSSAVKGTHV